jgi:membrane protein
VPPERGEGRSPRRRRLDTSWLVVRRAFREFRSDRCPMLAAAIAYSALFAVIPVVALLVASLGMILKVPEIARTVVERVLENVPLQSGLVVEAIRALSEASQPLSILGALALAWSAMNLFGTVRDALNVAWGVRGFRSLWRQKLIDLAAMLGLVLLFAGSILGTAALHGLHGASAALLGPRSRGLEPLWESAAVVFPAAITFAGFLFLYRYIPNVRHGYRDVWPGAALAAWLFELAKHGFAFYVTHFARHEALYGTLGAVMLFLLWVYVSAAILLAGAELSSVMERAVRGRATPGRPTPDIVLGPRRPSTQEPEASPAGRP